MSQLRIIKQISLLSQRVPCKKCNTYELINENVFQKCFVGNGFVKGVEEYRHLSNRK